MSRPSETESECVGKAAYASPQAAAEQVARFKKRGRGKGKSRNSRGRPRAYRCSHCGAWHIGSQSF